MMNWIDLAPAGVDCRQPAAKTTSQARGARSFRSAAMVLTIGVACLGGGCQDSASDAGGGGESSADGGTGGAGEGGEVGSGGGGGSALDVGGAGGEAGGGGGEPECELDVDAVSIALSHGHADVLAVSYLECDDSLRLHLTEDTGIQPQAARDAARCSRFQMSGSRSSGLSATSSTSFRQGSPKRRRRGSPGRGIKPTVCRRDSPWTTW